jgi:hypothetical protein
VHAPRNVVLIGQEEMMVAETKSVVSSQWPWANLGISCAFDVWGTGAVVANNAEGERCICGEGDGDERMGDFFFTHNPCDCNFF